MWPANPNPCDCGDNPNVDLAPNNDWEDLDGPTELQRGVHNSSGFAIALLVPYFYYLGFFVNANIILILMRFSYLQGWRYEQ